MKMNFERVGTGEWRLETKQLQLPFKFSTPSPCISFNSSSPSNHTQMPTIAVVLNRLFLYTKLITSLFLLPYSWLRHCQCKGKPLPHSFVMASPSSPSAVNLVPEADNSELKRMFQMFDRNGDGHITKKELSDSFKKLGIHIPEGELIGMVDKIDVNGDGYVDMEEFGTLYQAIMDERDEDEDMREAFNVFDQNGDGFITVEELQSVLASLGLKQGRTVEDCKKMINQVDVDGDGMVNFIEFKQMMRGGGFAALG